MKFMQPSNPRSETGVSNQQAPSGASSGVTPPGKGPVAPNVQQQQPEEPRRLSLAELFAEDDGDSSDDLSKQTDQCLRNIEAALEEAGASLADIVRVTYVLPDAKEFPECWPVLRRYFGEVRPAAMMISAGLSDPRSENEDRDRSYCKKTRSFEQPVISAPGLLCRFGVNSS
jgi:enamine deaminase RidA (YjgF/YER057c/UK114 family)